MGGICGIPYKNQTGDPMAVKDGDFVKLSFTAKLETGEVIDTTDEELAKKEGIYTEGGRYGDITIIIGAGHVVKGLEEDIIGKEPGYKGEVTVPPEKAFGERDPDLVEAISITKFREKPEIGQTVRLGNRTGIIEKIIGRRAIVDFNHPLAGKTIHYEYEIKEIIEEPEEKAKALLLLITGVDGDVELDASTVRFKIPAGASLSEWYILGKQRVADEIFSRLENIAEVQFIEIFEKKKEEKEEQKDDQI